MTQEFRLTRTDEPPVVFTGELIGSFKSSNVDVPVHTTSRQWFEVDVYKTTKGTWIAYARYRAGSKIRRERPVDTTFTARSSAELVTILDELDASKEFVTGWPGAGSAAENDGRDLRRNHSDVCKYAIEQWKDVVDKISNATDAEEPEVIE